jgi:hypothetical protein
MSPIQPSAGLLELTDAPQPEVYYIQPLHLSTSNDTDTRNVEDNSLNRK